MTDIPILQRIASRQARVCILGLGYVGLPLAVEFAQAGLPVVGVEVDVHKVEAINTGHSYIPDVPDEMLSRLSARGQLKATSDYAGLQEADAVIICVPTPLRKTRDPDISFIVATAEQIVRYVHPQMLVVLESTTYPGTTEELLVAPLTEAGYRVGEDIFLAFSPERIDPGNRTFGVRNTPKVVGGITPKCTEVAAALYRHAVTRVVTVSSARAAEMVKLLENTFRAVNIGLVNEMALICHQLGLDVWEVIEAAATKPYGYMPFYPGPGLGGHCLPIDPLYLSWKLKTFNYNARFIELADDINSHMPEHVVDKVTLALNDFGKPVKDARILILGVAYKRDVNDVRESPALEIIQQLQARGGQVVYHDPYVPRLKTDVARLESVKLDEQVLAGTDCVIVVTDHSNYDWAWVVRHARLVVDTRNALRDHGDGPARVVRL
jgi:UDP-N-acetyl-D-glucosamine dehydrogenase